jgi:hypothetical protein
MMSEDDFDVAKNEDDTINNLFYNVQSVIDEWQQFIVRCSNTRTN